MIAGIACVANEADILPTTLAHYVAEGVDAFYLYVGRSTDTTWLAAEEALRGAALSGGACIIPNPDPLFHQEQRINELAMFATEGGADWILPFDADEFLYATDGRTIAENLADLPDDVRKLKCRMWNHRDWHHRYIEPNPDHLPKVAYRPTPGARLTMGQHDVSLPGGLWGVLEVRHWQYRGPEHFIAKIRRGNETVAPEVVARGDATHITQYRDWTDDQLRAEWDRLGQVPTVLDPIPTRAVR